MGKNPVHKKIISIPFCYPLREVIRYAALEFKMNQPKKDKVREK